MKIRVTLLIALICSIFSFGNAAEKLSADVAVSFESMVYDFGTIKEKGGPVSHVFNFQNTGTEPLIIISAQASCGCTRPEFPKKPVAPGKKEHIKVTYNPDGRPGEFVKTITVRTNAKDRSQRKFTLKIKGNVIPGK